MTWRWSQTARRLPAKQFQVGSIPTGASDCPTAWFGLHPVKMTPSEPFTSLDGHSTSPTASRDYITHNDRLGENFVGPFEEKHKGRLPRRSTSVVGSNPIASALR